MLLACYPGTGVFSVGTLGHALLSGLRLWCIYYLGHICARDEPLFDGVACATFAALPPSMVPLGWEYPAHLLQPTMRMGEPARGRAVHAAHAAHALQQHLHAGVPIPLPAADQNGAGARPPTLTQAVRVNPVSLPIAHARSILS